MHTCHYGWNWDQIIILKNNKIANFVNNLGIRKKALVSAIATDV